MLVTPANYEPKAIFSASGISRARRCLHAWGLRYLLGIKKPEQSWAEVSALPEPVAKIKSKPTPEERAAKKAYNSVYRPALGKECHSRFEAYYKGGVVDWHDKPGRICLAAFEFLPPPGACDNVEAEGSIEIEVGGVRFRGFRDLLIAKDRKWLLVDFKTTFSFDFFDREKTQRTVKTPEQLIADPQANLYAFDVMRREGLTELACRWVYLRTEGKPEALPVDFVITWEDARMLVEEMAFEARELTSYIDGLAFYPASALVDRLEMNPEACKDFGGCEYHSERGGPCCTPPEVSPGQRLVQLRTKTKARAALPPRPKKERAHNMGFRDKPSKAPSPVIVESEGSEEAVDKEEAMTDEVQAPAPKAARATAAKSVDVAATEAAISFEGTTVAIPKSSPLYKSIVKVCNARKAFDGALSGE